MRAGLLILLVGCGGAWAGDVVMRTESWATTRQAHAECNKRIAHMHERNLLAATGVRVAAAASFLREAEGLGIAAIVVRVAPRLIVRAINRRIIALRIRLLRPPSTTAMTCLRP